jgi:hypothetical protein
MPLSSATYPSLADPNPDGALIYLDQWVWVKLAQAAASGVGIYAELLNLLIAMRASGRITVALSAGNYLELGHRRSTQSRRDVARVMAAISGYVTLSAIHLVQAEEVRRAAAWVAAPDDTRPVPIERQMLLGTGACHAFASESGRYRVPESADSGVEENLVAETKAEFRRIRGLASPEEWEWINLVGIDTDHNLHWIEYHAEHRSGDEFAEDRDRTRRFATETPNDGSLLYRAIVLEQLDGMRDMITNHMSSEEIDRFFRGPVNGAAFIGAIPTAKMLLELEFRALRNHDYMFRQHDRVDLFTLALALPYSDVVLVDAHWTHVVKAAGLDQLYRTQVAKNTKDLLTILQHLD